MNAIEVSNCKAGGEKISYCLSHHARMTFRVSDEKDVRVCVCARAHVKTEERRVTFKRNCERVYARKTRAMECVTRTSEIQMKKKKCKKNER